MAIGSRKHRTRRLHTHSKHGAAPDVRSEINVTPLVDVCLVLLIIFMVILPMLTRGKDVPLPETEFHSEEKDRQQPIVSVVEDAASGKLRYYIDQDEIEVGPSNAPDRFSKLKKALTEAQEIANQVADDRASKNPKAGIEPPGRRVYLKAGANLPYEKVYPIIIALHEAGAPNIDIGTNEVRDTK